jgi:hypothetical protein
LSHPDAQLGGGSAKFGFILASVSTLAIAIEESAKQRAKKCRIAH